jgi:hypothetical protein
MFLLWSFSTIPQIVANLKLPFTMDPEYQAACVLTAHQFSSTSKYLLGH